MDFSKEERKFREDLLILNLEYSTHRKTEAMKELLEIYNKQQTQIQNLQQIEQEHKKENGKLRSRVNELEEKIKQFYDGEVYTANQLKNEELYFEHNKMIIEIMRQCDYIIKNRFYMNETAIRNNVEQIKNIAKFHIKETEWSLDTKLKGDK